MAKVIGRVEIKVSASVDNDRPEMQRQMEKDLDRLEKKLSKRKGIKIPVHIDGDEVNDELDRAHEGAKRQAKKKKDIELKVGFDYDSVLAGVGRIREELRHLDDETIRVDLNKDALERKLDELEDRLRRDPIHMRISDDIDGYRDVIRKLETIKKDHAKVDLKFDSDEDSLEQTLAEFREKVKNSETMKIRVDSDSLESVERALKDIDAQLARNREVEIDVNMSNEDLQEARHKFEKFREDLENKDVDVPVNLTGMALAAARLQWLTRPRTVSIIARVDAKAAAVAIGVLRSLAGVNTLQKFGERLESIVTDFDQFAANITKVLGVVGNLSNIFGYMGTTLVSVAGGVAQVGGLAAILPTLAASMGSVFGVLRIGFNNFAESFSDIPDVAEAALAKLPPQARKARDALVGVFKDFQDPIQDLFWQHLGDDLTEFVEVVVPRVKRGMLEITPAIAEMTGDAARSFKELAENKSIDVMFDNLRDGLEEARAGVKPFIDAINTLGLRGSEFLPRIGRWLGDAGKQFEEFISHAEKMGHIEGWINDGLESLKDIWGVSVALTKQFKSLVQIVDAAGGQSLDGFRKNMEDWADVMDREPFRSRMVRMLRGARDGASELNVGFKELARRTGEMSTTVEALQVQLGKIGSGALERVADIITRPMMQAGLLNGLLEVERALDVLEPAAKNIGDTIGAMFDIAGDSVLGVAPLLNQVTDILRTIVFDLAPSLKATIPTLVSFLGDFVEVFGGGLQLATTVLGGVLDVVNALPGPLQTLTLAFGTFLALRGRIGGFMASMSGFWNTQKTTFKDGVAVVESNAQKFNRAYDGMVTKVGESGKRMSTAVKTGGLHFLYGTGERYRAEFDKMAAAAEAGTGRIERTVGRVKTAAGNFGRALSGIMAWGGGLGGMLVFTGLIAAIDAIGSAARKRREDIQELQTTMDEFGNATQDTAKKVAEWMQNTDGPGFDNLVQGFERVGIAASDVVDALSGDDADFSKFFDSLVNGQNDAKKALQDYEAAQRAQSEFWIAEQDQQYLALMQNVGAYDPLIAAVKDYGGKTQEARDKQKQIAEAMGTTNEEAKNLKDAMSTLGNEYKSGADKADAMTRALDILNGTMSEQDDATLAAADAIRALKSAIKDATTGDDKISLKDMIDNEGVIDISFRADPTGSIAKVQKTMRETMRTAIEEGVQAADVAPDAGKLTALKAKYEAGLRELKAEILPQLGKGGEKKLDAWLKANGYNWDTIEAVVTGKIDEAEWSKIPAEGKALLKDLIGGDPFIKVPIDGDYLPLEGKATIATGILRKLGAEKATPKIDANGKPLDDASQSAIEKLRGLSNERAEAIIDGDIKPLSKKEQEALRKLMNIDGIEAVPTLDANGKPLDDEIIVATAMLLGFDKEEAEAMLKANKTDVDSKVKAAQKSVDGLKQNKPIELDANGNPLKDQTKRGQAWIDGIKQKNKPKIDADASWAKAEIKEAERKLAEFDRKDATAHATVKTHGLYAVQTLKWYIDALRSKTITVTTNYAQRGAGPTRNTALADGGIMQHGKVKTFADGGINYTNKPASAHIAPAGKYVMYAEKETGGEAFIPLAASKRARSTKILAETARRFGMGLTQMENGGISGSAAAVPAVTIGTMYTANPDEAVRKIRESQRQAQALMNVQGGI